MLRGEGYGPPTAPPVVLLHGGGQTRHSWAGTGRALAAAGWYAVAVDLRGHGDSDWAPRGQYGAEEFSGDVERIAGSFSRSPALVGASLGGVAALTAVGFYAGQLASALVLVDIATRVEMAGAERIRDFMLGNPRGFASLEEVADAITRYNPNRPRPSHLEGLHKNLRLGDDGRYYWHWDPNFMRGDRIADGIRRSARRGEAARRLRLPTLLVRGRHSDIVSQQGVEEFLHLVPHARFVDIAGAGHMVAGDRNDAFTRAVVDFLTEHLPARGQPTS